MKSLSCLLPYYGRPRPLPLGPTALKGYAPTESSSQGLTPPFRPVLSHFFIRLEGLPSISSCLTKEDAGALNSEDSCAYVVSRDRGSRCFFLPSTVFRVRRNRWITLTLTSAKTLLPRFSLLTPPGLRRPTQLTLRGTTSRP